MLSRPSCKALLLKSRQAPGLKPLETPKTGCLQGAGEKSGLDGSREPVPNSRPSL